MSQFFPMFTVFFPTPATDSSGFLCRARKLAPLRSVSLSKLYCSLENSYHLFNDIALHSILVSFSLFRFPLIPPLLISRCLLWFLPGLLCILLLSPRRLPFFDEPNFRVILTFFADVLQHDFLLVASVYPGIMIGSFYFAFHSHTCMVTLPALVVSVLCFGLSVYCVSCFVWSFGSG